MSRSPQEPVAKQPNGTLGTFAGVFTPSVRTILGIILFLRLDYVVGNAGFGRALLIKGECMMKKYLLTFFILAVGFGFSTTHVFAYDDTASSSPLLGVDKVYVDVRNIDENVRSEVKAQGLIEDQLEAMITNKLEEAGIKAFSGYESDKLANRALLYLKLYILSPELTQKTIRTLDGEKVHKGKAENRYLFAAILELRQPVTLTRAPNITLSVATWSTESIGFRRVPGIHADVSGLVDSFVQAYKSANAKLK